MIFRACTEQVGVVYVTINGMYIKKNHLQSAGQVLDTQMCAVIS